MKQPSPLAFLLLSACAGARPTATAPPAEAPGPRTEPDNRVSPTAIDEARDTEFLRALIETQSYALGKPKTIKLAHDGSRVFFVRTDARRPVGSLYAMEVASGQVREILRADLLAKEEQLSPEEKARRERMRVRSRGITSYQLSEDGALLLVPYAGKVYVAQAEGDPRPREVAGPDDAGALPFDPKLSPDGKWVAFVRAGELWVAPVAGGKARQLTRGATATRIHAQAEFVAQEEMDRHTGYWWSPDSQRLAYEIYDAAKVGRLHLADPVTPFSEPRASEYPRAGTDNVDADLAIVAVTGGKPTLVKWDEARYPYLLRVTWKQNAPLTLDVMTRDQREQALLAADVKTGATRALLVEKDDVYLNTPNVYAWLRDGSGFLWASETSGRWQLALHAPDGKLVRTLTPSDLVVDKLLHVDLARRQVVVSGAADAPDVHLWSVPLDGGPATALSSGPAEVTAVYARDAAVHVRTTERTDAWSTSELVKGDGEVVAPLPSVGEKPPALPRVEVRQVTATLGGKPAPIWTATVRPRDFDPAKRYPVLVSVYGGPTRGVVTRAAESYVKDQWIADHGFVVVFIDGMGTTARGRAWERVIAGRFAEVPLEAQAEGLRALGAVDASLDLSRVGVYGHSFGGFLAALCVMRRPDVFHAAVASAPVTDWLDYDTFYTERYLGVPTDEATREVYARNGLVRHAAALTRPLLIMHGTADDNVLFNQALKLADALLRAGKDFELVPLAGQTHMIVDTGLQTAYWRRVFAFFRTHLAVR